jgi:outer membrane protein assembly factor BamA
MATTIPAARADEPLPAFMAGKRPLDARDLAEKKEGDYVTPIPLVDSDPDTGFGFGARLYFYDDGLRDHALFRYTPYRHRAFAQVFATTNGYQEHRLDYDAPYLADSPFRLHLTAYYERNTAQNYFGRGSATMGDLGFTAAGAQTFSSFDDYASALRRLRPGGVAYTLYNKYDLEDPGAAATLQRDFFGGVVRVQMGFAASYVRIRDFTGTQTEADDPAHGATGVAATMGTTRLREDCASARIVGCGGGVNDTLVAGVAFDTRDFEPDPNAGFFADATGEISSRYIGSEYDYARVTVSPRAFVSPFPALADLVIAGRAVYSVQSAGTPFFAMNTLAFTDGDRQGLGGLWTLRGYKQDRFVGAAAAMGNLEVRWTFADFEVASQRVALILVPFLDGGRVFDSVGSFTLKGWRRGEGAGLRVAWNKSTVIVFDYGVSSEDSGLYMDFGHQF